MIGGKAGQDSEIIEQTLSGLAMTLSREQQGSWKVHIIILV